MSNLYTNIYKVKSIKEYKIDASMIYEYPCICIQNILSEPGLWQ
jgi:hypothetical protein